jgi:hypothetical protein
MLAACCACSAVQAQHTTNIGKSCASPVCPGETTGCQIFVGHWDFFGDTTEILEAWDIVDPEGGAVRVPAAGNLPIIAVFGNSTCVVGGSLPCLIGPPGSTANGLPADNNPGFIYFGSSYVVQDGDPDPLPDRANVIVRDLCDDVDTAGCSQLPITLQALASSHCSGPGGGGEAHIPPMVGKSCTISACAGGKTDCAITVGYADFMGDTNEILEAWDVVDPLGDAVRIPQAGNLPITTVFGNTTCVVGGSLPCLIGPPSSVLSGLPGIPDPGVVFFETNEYVVQGDDPVPVEDLAHIVVRDLCDSPSSFDCVDLPLTIEAPASTVILSEEECAFFVGNCMPDTHAWSCPDNWELENPGALYPDNIEFEGPFHVELDAGDDVQLDVTVEIDTLVLRPPAVLHVAHQGGPGPISPGDLTVTGSVGIFAQSEIRVGGSHVIDVPTGPVIIDEGGSYAADPQATLVNPALITPLLQINSGACGAQGTAVFSGVMYMNSGGLLVDGGDDDPQDPGCCPPNLIVKDDAVIETATFEIVGTGQVEYTSTQPLELAGDFINHGIDPLGFGWLGGALYLGPWGGIGPPTVHAFEVAGRDEGAKPTGYVVNFAMGMLTVGGAASVTFADEFDNDGLGQGSCTEALYVNHLVLEAGAAITLADVNIYYLTLDDQGAVIHTPGCGDLLPVPLAQTAADCADADSDGIRDDGCLWWIVHADGYCSVQPIHYAEMGGSFGGCAPDGVADSNDRFHALNCFSDKDTTGLPGYPCESSPPGAYHVDAAALGEPCTPDGVCDGNDAFAAINAFEGITPCSCPADGGAPAPVFTPPDMRAAPARIRLAPSTTDLRPGRIVEVDVLLAAPLGDLRGYQLHMAVRGGEFGSLELVDIHVGEPSVFSSAGDDDSALVGGEAKRGTRSDRAALVERRATSDDHLHSARAALVERRATSDESRPYWSAFNLNTHQMLAGLDGPGIDAPAGAYLATFVYRASADARGDFVIELQADRDDRTQRTFLFPTPAGGRIDVQAAPAIIRVSQSGGRFRD